MVYFCFFEEKVINEEINVGDGVIYVIDVIDIDELKYEKCKLRVKSVIFKDNVLICSNLGKLFI